MGRPSRITADVGNSTVAPSRVTEHLDFGPVTSVETERKRKEQEQKVVTLGHRRFDARVRSLVQTSSSNNCCVYLSAGAFRAGEL